MSESEGGFNPSIAKTQSLKERAISTIKAVKRVWPISRNVATKDANQMLAESENTHTRFSPSNEAIPQPDGLESISETEERQDAQNSPFDLSVVPVIHERVTNRPELYFHGTLSTREGFLKEHGLLAEKPTLANTVETALLFAQRRSTGDNLHEGQSSSEPILTLWYPEKSQVNLPPASALRGGYIPTMSLTTETRQILSDKVEADPSINSNEKRQIQEFIEKAETVLPTNALGAIVRLGPQAAERIKILQQHFDREGMSLYASNKSALVFEAQQIFYDATITYLQEGRTIESIASDMVDLCLEHELQKVAKNLDEVLARGVLTQSPLLERKWRLQRERLANLRFINPTYDRYRSILSTRIGDSLDNSSIKKTTVA